MKRPKESTIKRNGSRTAVLTHMCQLWREIVREQSITCLLVHINRSVELLQMKWNLKTHRISTTCLCLPLAMLLNLGKDNPIEVRYTKCRYGAVDFKDLKSRSHYKMSSLHVRSFSGETIKLQAMQDAPPLQLYPASDKFLMWNQRKAAKYL